MRISFLIIYNTIIILTINFGSYVYSHQNTNLIEEIYNSQNIISESNIMLQKSNSMKNLHNSLKLENIHNNNNYYLRFNNNSNVATNEITDNTILSLSSISNSTNTTYYSGFSSIYNNVIIDNNSASVDDSNTSVYNSNTSVDDSNASIDDSNASVDNQSIKSACINNCIGFHRKYSYDNFLFISLYACYSESITNSCFINNNNSSLNLDDDINYLNNNIKFFRNYLQQFK